MENRGLLIHVDIKGVDTAKQASSELLVSKDRELRVFMKHGHADPKANVAYMRIAPPLGAMTKELIDQAVEKTIVPVLSQASK